ncbi:hypothetical protein N7532_005530 [Penicillium argentinense]|uniref:Uncharacterized protein n=1 Tax=Penicillium argentinense TaxID=1131581 RepID=A0A9W9FE85_9EURO|nr:uncharacterized protein N7532_005530 [Penicillium argentinense]KAJ5098529.1 hypothetical protein N7532_005530 [Penicillium argentinense]
MSLRFQATACGQSCLHSRDHVAREALSNLVFHVGRNTQDADVAIMGAVLAVAIGTVGDMAARFLMAGYLMAGSLVATDDGLSVAVPSLRRRRD